MRLRQSARLVILSTSDRILLFQIFDARIRDVPFWVTPGGGLEGDETFLDAAKRELLEETGIGGVEIGAHLWTREGELFMFGETMFSHERYFLVRVPDELCSFDALLDYEKPFIRAFRWWGVDEMRDAERDGEIIRPENLSDILAPILAGHMPAEPLILPGY